jgi:ferredoxin
MQIDVDSTRCEAHGQCHTADQELFPLDDTGHSAVGQGRLVPPEKAEIALVGVQMCPVAALRLRREALTEADRHAAP